MPARRRSPFRRPAVLLAAVAAGLALGLAIDVLRAGGIQPWLTRNTAGQPIDVPPYDARGRPVEVDGRAVYLDCRGPADAGAPDGNPTVILEAGFGASAATWGHVLDGVAAFARVCAWDRPGLGRSQARGRHGPGEALDDLWRALDASGERGPYVVAAHSFGGVYARILAGRRPDDVAAVLMIDAYYPDVGIEDDPSLPADFRAGFRRSLDETAAMLAGGEDLDWPRLLEELREAGPFDGPAIMLSVEPRLRPFHADPETQALILAAFEASIQAMFPNGRMEHVPDTGHLIQLERPELVVERVRELVDAVSAVTALAATATALQRSP